MALYKSTLRREIVRGKVGKVKLFVICVRVCVDTHIFTYKMRIHCANCLVP